MMRPLLFLLVLLALACSISGCGSHRDPGRADEAHAHPPDHARHHPGSGHPGHAEGAPGNPHGGHHADFSDVPRFAKIFDDPERRTWQHPAEVVALLEPSPGMTIVDLGAGTGYFESLLAAAVAPGGRVLALDVEPAMVEYMNERFATAGLESVEARVVRGDDPELPPGSVDRILIVDTWHHLPDRERYAKRLRTALRPGGSILVVDFTPESPHGPPASMRLSEKRVADELLRAGFEVDVLEESLPWQYAIRAR